MTKTHDRYYAAVHAPPLSSWQQAWMWCADHPKHCAYLIVVHVTAGLWWYYVMGVGSALKRFL